MLRLTQDEYLVLTERTTRCTCGNCRPYKPTSVEIAASRSLTTRGLLELRIEGIKPDGGAIMRLITTPTGQMAIRVEAFVRSQGLEWIP